MSMVHEGRIYAVEMERLDYSKHSGFKNFSADMSIHEYLRPGIEYLLAVAGLPSDTPIHHINYP